MSEANGPTTFADSGQSVIERALEVESVQHSNLETLYEIERTVERILEGGYTKVALQFPDELLADAANVATLLRDRTKRDIFVLADTSYGSCCVDEVAAEHVNAHLIIHYGRSCLSPTSRLPVLYIFGQQQINVEDCVAAFKKHFPEPESNVILMCDVEYSYAMDAVAHQLSDYPNLIRTRIQTESNLQSTLDRRSPEEETDATMTARSCCGDKEEEEEEEEEGGEGECCRRARPIDLDGLKAEKKRGGRYYELPEGVTSDMCSIFFVGVESLTLTNIMMVHNKCPIFTYDPRTRISRRETAQVNKMLMKRYFLVQKAKDADTIGIVVGTLGVASYMNIIDHLKNVIRASGRKSYTFVMGKLNVAKMANFAEVDCYVLVACPENSLIDSKEFYRPIVTPFELELALVRSKEWTGDYITDFSNLLPGIREDNFAYDEEASDASSDEEPHFSLVTGQYKSSPFHRVSGKNNRGSGELLESKLTDLSLRSQNTSITRLLGSTAGEHLKSRSFRGLEPNLGLDEASTVQEGRSGIARGYSDEKEL
ncbi:diphthamide biosynthesis protein 2 [Syncephalastrum racemosum]|uniref:2-(3-amino-3-carboxypropyl)histidine synthase subunit 2 n=1 Tax=Syncephalastrum racemosum TaxID=13706 RepID=A0A1X2HBI6_SYNRA|nr:diphthamide biosynthesis protein 2 [Syncephalastrum racemosum]